MSLGFMNRLVNFLKVINFYQNTDKSVKIKVGNKAYAYEGLAIKENYVLTLETFFKSGLQRVDFAKKTETANIINDYVNDVTDGLIDRIVEPGTLTTDTRYLSKKQYFRIDFLEIVSNTAMLDENGTLSK